MKVLIIEDDLLFVQKVTEYLSKYQIESQGAENLESGLLKLKKKIFDCIILDLNLPDMNGKELIAELRSQKDYTPIIVLSSSCEIGKKTEALDLGADDYITKPCNGSELLARIRSVTRRSNFKTGENITYVGELKLDFNKKLITLRGISLTTTDSEYKIMELMIRQKGNVVSKKNIIDYLYGNKDKVPRQKIIDVFFCNLRKKINGILGPNNYINTYWGSGYQLKDLPPIYENSTKYEQNIEVFPQEKFVEKLVIQENI